jgi:hypothetical protein
VPIQTEQPDALLDHAQHDGPVPVRGLQGIKPVEFDLPVLLRAGGGALVQGRATASDTEPLWALPTRSAICRQAACEAQRG